MGFPLIDHPFGGTNKTVGWFFVTPVFTGKVNEDHHPVGKKNRRVQSTNNHMGPYGSIMGINWEYQQQHDILVLSDFSWENPQKGSWLGIM